MKWLLAGCFLLTQVALSQAQSLRDSLTFHASFDRAPKADTSKGDPQLYTAATVARKEIRSGLPAEGIRLSSQGGRYGGCLVFDKKVDEVVMFRGAKNIAYDNQRLTGTVSFWMSLDPASDLPTGYVDPLQITDKTWNNASLFLDFTQENPRQFRLGVFSDLNFWNPEERPWDEIPDNERPLVPVKQLPFARDKWTHVAITWQDFNVEGKEGIAELFLDGKSQGKLTGPQQFTWTTDDVAIMLGIYYVGRLDDFSIFDRPLSDKEIGDLMRLPEGIKSLE